MKLLTTLLLICSTMFVQAQDIETKQAIEKGAATAANTVASEIERPTPSMYSLTMMMTSASPRRCRYR